MSGETPAGPITIVVTVEIAPDRIDDFIRAITINAEGSRTEPGCLRFDVMQCQDMAGSLISSKFQFFEVYKDEASITFHREQPHFKAWGDFKTSGGVVADSQKVQKSVAILWSPSRPHAGAVTARLEDGNAGVRQRGGSAPVACSSAMGGIAAKEKAAKDAASFTTRVHLQVDRKQKGYYSKDNIDGYKRMRIIEGIQSHALDKDLLVAIAASLDDDGKIDLKEARDTIIPFIADGRWGRSELTCNERWTVRYGLSEFKWDADARFLVRSSFTRMNVLDHFDKNVTDHTEKARILMGPPLAELREPPAKRAKGGDDGKIAVDGMMLDKGMLLAARQGLDDDGVIDALEAVKIFHEAADDGLLTLCERWTFRFLISAYTLTDAAFFFLVEALSKVEQSDSTDA